MGVLEKLFGKPKTTKELMREYKRSIERSIRELDRERFKMEQEEKKQIIEMKNMAKKNQTETLKIMAKNLVQTRSISLQITTMASTQEMTMAMKKCGRVMAAMNKQMNMPEMQRIMREFAKESEVMDMKEEMVGDAIDDVMEGDNDEEEEEELVNQVLDEIGLAQKVDLPKNKLAKEAQQEQEDDLEARLANLKQ
ncbi:vacuolar protein sorting protein VPS2 [Acrasis kona]|uniref:Vacuolar protein sorting protein VPS2 n=1 Tax=Acrasis kona TaxID=1008807 RepID=A0AAW2ZJW2_9EUKA